MSVVLNASRSHYDSSVYVIFRMFIDRLWWQFCKVLDGLEGSSHFNNPSWGFSVILDKEISFLNRLIIPKFRSTPYASDQQPRAFDIYEGVRAFFGSSNGSLKLNGLIAKYEQLESPN